MLTTLLSKLNHCPEECVRRLLTRKEAMEEKGLRVNAGKTKIMISGEFPCAVCRTGVGSNSILC